MSGQRLAYVCVSTVDQNEKRQLEARFWTGSSPTGFGQGHQQATAHGTTPVRPRREHRGGAQHGRLARNLVDVRALVHGLTREGVRVEFRQREPALHR